MAKCKQHHTNIQKTHTHVPAGHCWPCFLRTGPAFRTVRATQAAVGGTTEAELRLLRDMSAAYFCALILIHKLQFSTSRGDMRPRKCLGFGLCVCESLL